MKEPLHFTYHPAIDVLEIEGFKYAGALFRSLSGEGRPFIEPGQWYRLVERKDGVLTISTRVEEKE